MQFLIEPMEWEPSPMLKTITSVIGCIAIVLGCLLSLAKEADKNTFRGR